MASPRKTYASDFRLVSGRLPDLWGDPADLAVEVAHAHGRRLAQRSFHGSAWRQVERPANAQVQPHSGSFARLQKRLEALEEDVTRLKALESEVTSLRQEVEALRSVLGLEETGTPVEVPPGLRWLAQHPEVAQQYSGKEIAIEPERGVVAVADDLTTLYKELQARGLLGKVLIECVP